MFCQGLNHDGDLVYSRTSNGGASGVPNSQNIRGVPLAGHHPIRSRDSPETKEGGLFASYINTFLQYKQEVSGPPDWIETPVDVQQYIDRYLEKEGVSLDGEK